MKTKKLHNLFIRVIDEKREPDIDAYGEEIIYTKWIKVDKAELGSLKKPNTKILGVRFEPVPDEEEDKSIRSLFFR